MQNLIQYLGAARLAGGRLHKSVNLGRSMRKAIISLILLMTPLLPALAAEVGELKEDAPDRYIVVPGDTLWGISGRFLKDVWKWPDVWRMNQEQVRNPHRIYPGDVIVLDRSGGAPQLRLLRDGAGDPGAAAAAAAAAAAGRDTVKLSPRTRAQPLADKAVPAIPPSAIEPFLSRPLVVELDGLDKAPRIIAAQADRVYLGSGDVAYVSGIKDAKLDSLWQIYRPGKPLIDPETQKTLGYEAVFLGDSKVTTAGDPATIQIFGAQQEIGKGDRLVAAGPLTLNSYLPHAPRVFVQGRIIASRGGMRETAPQDVVTLNKGRNDGLEPGNVLALLRLGRTNVEKTRDPKWFRTDKVETTKLPDERYGLVFVFRTFDKVSYALVMSASRTVQVGDVVTSP